jgi:hypothetical protein
VWGPLTLRRLVLLPMIYFVDFKTVLGRFIQWWSREMTQIDDVALPWPLLHLPPVQGRPGPHQEAISHSDQDTTPGEYGLDSPI